MNELMTPRGEALTGTPWDVYPRPQLRRESYVNLNGTWDFAVTAGPSPESYDREIRVPYCPESALSGVREHPSAPSRIRKAPAGASPRPTGTFF